MSLDVYLTVDEPVPVERGSGIFVRINGETKEVSREEWDAMNPGVEPKTIQRDEKETNEVFSAKITHNLGMMADEAGIYKHLWRPEEIGITKAHQLIEPLIVGVQLMKSDPDRFRKHDAPNGWGTYNSFVPWVEEYIHACCRHPMANVSVWR
jgi:hypothetical protein